MTVYTATPEMCHTERAYGEHLLPYDWPGRRFTLEHDLVARLDPGEGSPTTMWHITQELSQKIKASVETVTEEETPTATELLALKDENERMKTTITQQSEELDRLRVIADRAEELSTFKRRVGEVAMEYAERYDWCSTVKEALDEMGIEVPTKEYVFTLSVVYRVRGTKESYGEPDSYDLQRNAYLDAGIAMTMDGWGDLEVEYVDHDVMDVEEVEL